MATVQRIIGESGECLQQITFVCCLPGRKAIPERNSCHNNRNESLQVLAVAEIAGPSTKFDFMFGFKRGLFPQGSWSIIGD